MDRRNHAQRVVIAETFRLIEGLANAAFQSALTRLPNRAALDLLAAEHDRRATPPFAVAYADLTGFKAINTRHGHDGGDTTITEFGVRLRAVAEACEGYAFHLSGDEFLVLFPPERLDDFSERSSAIHHFAVQFAGNEIRARANFGVALPFEAGNVEELQRRAEQACGQAKTQQMSRPLIWREAAPEVPVIDRRWRCAGCQATVSLLLPVERHRSAPFRCVNCGEALPD